MKKKNNVILVVVVVLVILGTIPIVKLHKDYIPIGGHTKVDRRYRNVSFWFYLKSLFSGQINLKGLIIDEALVTEDMDDSGQYLPEKYVRPNNVPNDGRLY